MQRTFRSRSNRWNDGEAMPLVKDEADKLLSAMQMDGGIAAYMKATQAQAVPQQQQPQQQQSQEAAEQQQQVDMTPAVPPPPATPPCDPQPASTEQQSDSCQPLQETPTSPQADQFNQGTSSSKQLHALPGSTAHKNTEQRPTVISKPGHNVAGRQQLQPAARGSHKVTRAAASKACAAALKLKRTAACSKPVIRPGRSASSVDVTKAASAVLMGSCSGKVRYIKPPEGLLSQDPRAWEMQAQLSAGVQQRAVAWDSEQQQTGSRSSASASSSSSSSAAAAAAAAGAAAYPAPCHKVLTAPVSGIKQHTIVTAPATSFQEYTELQQDALDKQRIKQRTIIITPVGKGSQLAMRLLSLVGYQDRCIDVLLVSQHFYRIRASKQASEHLFQEVQQDIRSSLTEEDPVAIRNPQLLSGFVQLKGPTLLISIPQTCTQLIDVNFSHVVAMVHPTPLRAFSTEQMEALIGTAVPACQDLLALPGLPTWPQGAFQQSASVLAAESDLTNCMSLLRMSKSAELGLRSRFEATLELLMRLLTLLAPWISGIERQKDTRGLEGDFFSDGLRSCGGGGEDTKARGWSPGTAEWYHCVGPDCPAAVSKDPAQQQQRRAAYFKALMQQQQAWRACRASLMTPLYSYLSSLVGPVLIAYQTAVSMQPGMEDVRLQQDVPYQQIQSSLNAHVGAHRDTSDLLGTTIIWLSLAGAANSSSSSSSSRKRPAPEPSRPGAAFLLYDLGCFFEVGDRSHLWVRSDRYCHGTIRDYQVPEGALLFGTAFANKKDVTRDVLKVWHTPGAQITWRRQYDAQPHETAHVQPRRKAAAAAAAAKQVASKQAGERDGATLQGP